VPDAATAAGLRQQPQVAEAFRRHGEITKAVVAVGSWKPPNSQLRDALGEAERRRLEQLGVRAEVCGTLVDAHGQALDTELSTRVLSITGEALRRIPDVIAVVGGADKAAATRAILLGGYASSLVTDRTVADHLLSIAEARVAD
jgi:DNA-binding transcriptional regulator LsrR (DeoR family)